MAKESLFNILFNHFDFDAISVLDLFSGTGSISYEFASRGCPEVHLVESHPGNFSFILKTSENLGFKEIQAFRSDAGRYIRSCHTVYDIVFADPPYDLEWLEELPGLVLDHGLLKPGGWFILEHPRSVDFRDNPFLFDHRNYGNVHFSFFRKAEGG